LLDAHTKPFIQGSANYKKSTILNNNGRVNFNEIHIDCADAGIGIVDVVILDQQGNKDTCRPIITKKSEELWIVEYTATVEGLHSINVFFAGKSIPNSPIGVGIAPGIDFYIILQVRYFS